ncbi:MAG: DUF3368 domain-containing protein [Candidatus Kapaibacterium sp.]|nr:MAG: DUF3368 domain-containing protein [Candidatus Kapabacteria bacterium]
MCAIGRIELLTAVYGLVIILDVVRAELAASPRIAPLARAAEARGVFSVSSSYNPRTASLLRQTLDAGESAAIALALENNADLLLIDEHLGRSVAKSVNISVMGVLGILLEAKKRGILEEISPVITDLITIANFRIAPSLQAHVLSLAGEKPL